LCSTAKSEGQFMDFLLLNRNQLPI